MLDTNKFKRSVKEWVRENPNGSLENLVDYCEELIPPGQYNNYSWIVEQTAGWYEHVLSTRRSARLVDQLESDDVA
jgi:hypothetical protein